jgi:aspartate/methionine/tyrosine aminotransferase
LEIIASAAEENNCWIISDEIYARLAYDGREIPSILSLPGMLERSVLVDGYSKTYAMTGWRLGYAVMPEGLTERVELLLTHSIGCTATFTQLAGIEAIKADQHMVADVVAKYQQRRDHIVSGLNKIQGVHCQKPQGAFYVFPNVKAFGLPVREIARLILDEAGVAVLPGTDFGQFGEGYLRLCYATSIEVIDKALMRIAALFEGINK